MDAIKGILAEYYWIFLIVGVVLLISLVGFIASTKKKTKAQQPAVEEQKEETSPEMPAPPQPVEGAILDLTPVQTSQPYVEPSLDGLASNATEVKLGFETAASSGSIFEDAGPMLVIEDTSTASPVATTEPAVSLVIEEPAVQAQSVMPVETTVQPVVPETEFGLVIEDTTTTQVDTPVVETTPMAQPVVAAEPVTQSVLPEPEFGLVIEDTSSTPESVTTPVAETVPSTELMIEELDLTPTPAAVPVAAPVEQAVQAMPVQPQPAVQPQVVAQPVMQSAPATVPVQSAPVQEQQSSIFESDAPTLVIPDPSANQQQM